MRFKIDENLPVEIAGLLTKAGYDAKTVNEQGLCGTKDNILIDVCKKEERILITLDADFSDIKTYPPENYAGIIVMGVKSQAKSHVVEIFRRAIPQIKEKSLKQHLWIVEETRIRIRGKDDKT